MKKKSKKTDKPGNKEDRPIPVSPASFSPRSPAKNSFVHIACLTVLIVIIYSNTINAPFQWDESDFIVNNPIIKDLHYFTSPSDAKGFELYSAFIDRYIGYLTFALNYKIHGFSVAGYHIVNIAIHVGNSILVYLFVLLTFRTPYFREQGPGTNGQEPKAGSQSLESRYQSFVTGPLSLVHDHWSLTPELVAFFSAAIFASHPLQTMAVTYVFQRLASLVTFFYLVSLVAYIKARLALTTESTEESFDLKKPKKFIWSAQSSSLWPLWLIISFLSAVLAMKTKEDAVTLPVVITLFEFCFFAGPIKKKMLYLAPILLTLVIIPLTLMSLTGMHQIDPGSYGDVVKEHPRWDYFFTQLRVVVTYLRLLFFPVNQNIAYDYPVFKSFFDPPVLLSFLFLSALYGLGVYMITGNRQWAIGNEIKAKSKKGDSNFIPLNAERSTLKAERLVGFGILWFFITLSVESSIIPLPMLINEYRVYLPSVGVIISTVTGVFLLKESSRSLKAKKSVLIVLILAIGVLSVAAYLRNDLWGDDIRLWEDTARKSPHRAAVHYNIGNIYRAHNMPDQAIEQYMITINLAPDYPEPHNNLGVIYEARNMPDKAMEQYLTAINLDPDYAEAHYNLGVAYQDLGMADKAMEQYLITIKLKPYYVGAHNNLGNIYKAISMPHKAMEQYLITVRLRPDGAEAHFNLGSLYYNMGQTENARRELLIGLKIKPDDQRAQQLLRAVLH